MKQLVAAAVCVLALSCSSSTSSGTGKVPLPDIRFVQLVGPEQLNWPSGEFEVKYGLRIQNHADEQITLSHIDLTPSSSEGAYVVRQRRYMIGQKISAQGSQDVEFWAKAWSAERARYNIGAQSPITVRGVAFFNSATGSFRRVFVGTLSQAASGR
jgi:hypothetical protein